MPLPPSRASGPYRPTRLGQWEVIAKIAGGGMSAIYLGRNIDSPPDSPNVVALKIAKHDSSMDERLVKMFLEEGKLIQRLVHPNIVRTLEVGADAEQDFIAMELMMGKTFAQVHDTIAMRNVRMSPEIAVWAAARVADALAFAHDLADETTGRPLNLVHRDVNPANIFATFSGEVKLFDFGLAKVTTGDTASSQQLLAGKLSYLSPEQVMQIPVDRRSDIFSLGTTLWELLTGKRLFRRDSDIDTVRAVQLGQIPDIRTVAPELPEELSRITRTALERNRDHRYPNASYLARELDNWLFQRSSPQDVTSRLAQLVDTIFPGEKKRQSGWLKPAVTSAAMSKPNAFAATMASPVYPPPKAEKPERPHIEIRRDSREVTAVMAHAPIHTPRDGVPAIDPSELPTTPKSAAPSTPRFGSGDGVERASWTPPRRSSQRPPPVRHDTPPPISHTNPGLPLEPEYISDAEAPLDAFDALEALETQPDFPDIPSEPPTDVNRAPDLTNIDIESTIVASGSDIPPLVENLPVFPPPPAPPPRISAPPPQRPSIIPPPAVTPRPAPAPKPVAAIPAPIGTTRPKRAPIPLPSRVPPRTSVAPKPMPSVPPKAPDSSKTQIDTNPTERKR